MIPFNVPYYSGREIGYISKVIRSKTLTGDLEITRANETFFQKRYGFSKLFLTNSCTMALEMAALIVQIEPGDEVILPSYTFVSTANAFALRGAKLIFVDSRSDHPNMNEDLIEKLITPKTKAIVVVHYAGTSCNMGKIKSITDKHKLWLIEDAAQGIDSFYEKMPLGTIGDIACFSFHETKNIHCGEGGLIAINNEKLQKKAEEIRNKGTNRTAFLNGDTNKYEWVGLGLSSIPSAITAAFLFAQLQKIDKVQKKRIKLWELYYDKLSKLKEVGIQLPTIPAYASNNAHIFYLVCPSLHERDALIAHLKKNGIQAVFHYQALHSSVYYREMYDGVELKNVERYSNCLVRLPLYFDLSVKEQNKISNSILAFYFK